MKRIFFLFFVLLLLPGLSGFGQDKFANIGTRKYENRMQQLIVPHPLVLPDISLPVTHTPDAVFKKTETISTKEEVDAALDKLREKYHPFMKNVAPKPETTRKKIFINDFNWRIETELDRSDFISTLQGKGEWTKVDIPHYGPPLGRAVTYYFKEISLSSENFSKGSLFICFKGVDYKATVFVNGTCCGSHEGFFSPFEFDITRIARVGKNRILVKVENDYTTTGEEDEGGNQVIGNKIYGATGPGYDDPATGWHHCPPGMGIYQDCYLEARSPLHINDLFVRPALKDSVVETWVEINNFNEYPANVRLTLSVYGQNFSDTVIETQEYIPSSTFIPGVGDLVKPTDWEKVRLKMGYGVNYLRIPLEMGKFRLWNTETPWLYQLQVNLYDEFGNHVDTKVQQFGMRSFTMDTVNIPKGKMFLNGEMVRLRGANTMGHLQQCVIRKDWNQLRDDILLAKLCNMNYLRFTQRPVQPEIYEYCDKLGLMNQTDFPLFGSIRRNQFAEAVKQTEEMERLVRGHPSSIMVTYINERFPNAEGHPQRSLNQAEEYNRLFKALDQAVLLNNPDRVIKVGDGDYDPPSPGLPDSHCYNTWYNGHGLGLGEMYKGYWQPVKPGWMYACGEFGAEGLDPLNVMEKYYPKEWLPKDEADEKLWTANRIPRAQTQRFHYMWYNTQHSLKDWIEASQEYQAWAVKFVTEAFRRDSRMVSFAVHLFVDAWPAGWMKAIMDVDRQPKKAWFAYRDALEPLMVSLRSDRRNFYPGEKTEFEIWICNDRNQVPQGYQLKYQVEKENGKVILANQVQATIRENGSKFQGVIKYFTPEVSRRTTYILRVALFNEKNESVCQNEMEFEVFPRSRNVIPAVYILGNSNGIASQLAREIGMKETSAPEEAKVIFVDDFLQYLIKQKLIDNMVRSGKRVIFLELPVGNYHVAGTTVSVEKTSMGDYYFVSPETGHPMMKKFKAFDFRFWYSSKKKIISPILAYTFRAEGWTSVLSSGDSNWLGDRGAVMAAGELKYGNGFFRVCEVQLCGKTHCNPVAREFLDILVR